MELQAIFLAEFDNTLGPVVSFQSPEGTLTGEMVDALSEFIIPQRSLFGHSFSISVFDKVFVGAPELIENVEYERNTVMFHVGFVLARLTQREGLDWASFTERYQAAAAKTARLLRHLEVESRFLSEGAHRPKLFLILEETLDSLQRTGKCAIEIDRANILFLDVRPQQLQNERNDEVEIRPSDVPVVRAPLPDALIEELEIIEVQVLQFVDGSRHVRRIAELSDVGLRLTQKSIQSLRNKNLVAIIDTFQYSSVYSVISGIHRLWEDEEMRMECLRCVVCKKPGTEIPASNVPISRVFALYCRMKPALRLGELCLQNANDLDGIDIRALVAFGLLNRLIRRIHPYPVLVKPENADHFDERDVLVPEILAMTGASTLDDLAVEFNVPSIELEESAASHSRSLVVFK